MESQRILILDTSYKLFSTTTQIEQAMRYIVLTFLFLLTFSLFPAQMGRTEAVYPKSTQRISVQTKSVKSPKNKQPRPPKDPRKAIQFAALGLYLSLAAGGMVALFFFFDILLFIYLPLIILMTVLSSIFIMLAVIWLMGTAYRNFKTYNREAATLILFFLFTRIILIGVIWYFGGPFSGILMLLLLLPALIIYLISIFIGMRRHIDNKEENELLNIED